MSDEWLDLYITHLSAYKKSGFSWGGYASKKLTQDERREFARIINELHENGFYDPHVVEGKLRCFTLVVGRKPQKREVRKWGDI